MPKTKMNLIPTVEFGKVYRDRITGFEGKCTGKSSFISGCDQVLLAPPAKPVERVSRKGGPQHTPAKS